MSSSGSGSRSMEVDLRQEEFVGSSAGSNNPSWARRCAGCKYLRRRCAPDCVLAPYFPASQPRRYADVHAVFGTSNATRLLQSLPVQERGRAADTMAAEARWRVQDPVYGSAGIIDRLQQEIRDAQRDLATARAELAFMQMMHGGAAVMARHHAPQSAGAPSTLFLPAAAAAAEVCNRGGRLLAVRHEEGEEEEAPPMDPDEFLDLGDL